MSFISTAVAFVVGILKGWFGTKSEPTAVVLATSAATAQTSLAQERSANEVLLEGAAARAAADAQRVRTDPHADEVHADPAAPINLGADGRKDPDIRD